MYIGSLPLYLTINTKFSYVCDPLPSSDAWVFSVFSHNVTKSQEGNEWPRHQANGGASFISKKGIRTEQHKITPCA